MRPHDVVPAGVAGAVLRGLRARALLSAGSVLLTVLAVGSAVLGPVFQVAVTGSYLVSRLADAPPDRTGLAWVVQPAAGLAGDPAAAAEAATDAVRALDPDPWTPLRPSWESERVPGLGGEVALLARDGACERLDVEGRCPEGPTEALVLAGDLERSGVGIGDRVPLRGAGDLAGVEVVGSYRAPEADDFWPQPLRFVSSPAREAPQGTLPYRPAPFVVDVAAFGLLPAGSWQVRVDAPLEVDPAWTTDDLGPLVEQAAGLGAVELEVPAGTVAGDSLGGLERIAEDVRAEQATARSSVAPAVLSLVLVALALLMRLLLAAGDLRVPELALASLRGLRARRLWALGLAEPLALVVLAAPLGVLAGLGLSWALVEAWLVPGLPLRVPAASLVAALLVLAAAVAVAAVGVGLVLRVSLAGQLAGARRPAARGRVALLLELVLWAAAVAVLATELGARQGRTPDVTDLVLPVLLAVVAGLAAVRLTARAARWWTARHAGTRSLGGYVAARALSRRREGTLVILPLTAAVAVGVFSVGVHDAAASWRGSVAATDTPAGGVWATELTLPETVAVTRELDPDGTWLMAASTGALGSQAVTLVDAPRLPRVAAWPGSWTPGTTVAQVAERLGPGAEAPVVTGDRVALTVDHVTAEESRGTPREPLVVELRLRSSSGEVERAYLGPYAADAGPTTRSTALPACGAGCRLEGLTVGRTAGLPVLLDGTVTLSALRVDGAAVEDAFAGAGWAVSPEYAAQTVVTDLAAEPSALRLSVTGEEGEGVARLSAGGIPAAVPVLLGDRAADALQTDAEGRTVLPVTGGQLLVDPRGRAASTPFAGPDGVLADLTVLTSDRSFFDQSFTTRVLARADTPAALREELSGRGLVEVATLAGTEAALDRSAYALALRLYLVVAALVLLMALAGLVVSTAVQLPERRRDAASLRVVGVRRGAVVSTVVRETGVVLGSAALAGIAAGTLAQWVVLRTITLGVGDRSTPAVVADVDPQRLVLTGLLAALALGAVAVVSGLLTVRGARGATLRENGR